MAGKAEGGLTWTQDPPILYEDVTTNAKGREKDPVENTWGALHEYHHVFQVSQVDSYAERDGEKNFSSWMAEGMASYSSAKFMDDLGLANFKDYMLQLRTFHIYEYYGGEVKNGARALLIGAFVLRPIVLGLFDCVLWKLVVSVHATGGLF